MGKTKFKAKIDSQDEKSIIYGNCIFNNNKITYKEKDKKVTILISDNIIEMIRECNDYKIHLIFQKDSVTQSTYQLFGGNKIFNLETKTEVLDIGDKKIQIDYILEDNKFSYILEME